METATTVPPGGFGKLQLRDFVKSILIAAGANALISIYAIIQSGDWPTREDWGDILQATIAFIISYLLKNVFTNNVGEMFKKDQPVITVSKDKLEKLEADAIG